jgi:hypothetical protein
MSNPHRERTLLDALQKERLYRTDEMLDWLSETAGIPGELSEAFLGSWVGLLRQRVLHHALTDERYLSNVREGHFGLGLGRSLGPADYHPAQVVAQFGEELELPREHIILLVNNLGTKLLELGEEHKAFEPVGWVESARYSQEEEWAELPRLKNGGEPAVFLIHFWSDFLSPSVEVRRPPVEGGGEGDPGDAYSRWAK